MLENLAGTLSDRSLQLYTKSWELYTGMCGARALPVWSAASVLAWRTSLVDAGYGPNTINSHLSAIKSIFKASIPSGEVSVELYTQVRAVGSVSVRALRERLRPGKTLLTDETVEQMIGSVDTGTIKGLRDRAILYVLATTGMRIEELTTLKRNDWNPFTSTITVLGKTDIVPREVPVTEGAARAILAWLYARNSESEWIFTGFAGKSLQVQDKPITTQGAYAVVVAAAKAVGVSVSPHDFRRFVATKLAGRNIVEAQVMLGHASIATTQRYVKRADLPVVDWLG